MLHMLSNSRVQLLISGDDLLVTKNVVPYGWNWTQTCNYGQYSLRMVLTVT